MLLFTSGTPLEARVCCSGIVHIPAGSGNWRRRELNPRSLVCKTNALPLSYIPILPTTHTVYLQATGDQDLLPVGILSFCKTPEPVAGECRFARLFSMGLEFIVLPLTRTDQLTGVRSVTVGFLALTNKRCTCTVLSRCAI